MTGAGGSVTVWFYRHGAVDSHSGDVPLTESGLREAEAAGARLARSIDPGARVEFLHAPTQRTLQTLQALRRGLCGALDPDTAVELGEPLAEHAIRNPDVFVAGTRVELVSTVAALAEQLPDGVVTHEDLAAHAFFSRFWAERDRILVWLKDADPPGERAGDVARRFLTFARSLRDAPDARPRHYVCVTHSGPMRALLLQYVLDHDPGEPDYAEAIELNVGPSDGLTWRFRDTVTTAGGDLPAVR